MNRKRKNPLEVNPVGLIMASSLLLAPCVGKVGLLGFTFWISTTQPCFRISSWCQWESNPPMPILISTTLPLGHGTRVAGGNCNSFSCGGTLSDPHFCVSAVPAGSAQTFASYLSFSVPSQEPRIAPGFLLRRLEFSLQSPQRPIQLWC